MSRLFPRWVDTLARATTYAVLFGVPVGAAMLFYFYQTPFFLRARETIQQPVPFDHQHHVQWDGISCLFCHDTVFRSDTASIPPTETCMACHAQLWNEAPLLQPVMDSWFTGLPIPWRRVYKLPDYVYFNHAIHVNKGVGCATCHGRVDAMPRVRREVSLYMKWCLECHRHPQQYLRPADEVLNMTWQPRRDLGATLATQLGVRPRIDCYTCHR